MSIDVDDSHEMIHWDEIEEVRWQKHLMMQACGFEQRVDVYVFPLVRYSDSMPYVTCSDTDLS